MTTVQKLIVVAGTLVGLALIAVMFVALRPSESMTERQVAEHTACVQRSRDTAEASRCKEVYR